MTHFPQLLYTVVDALDTRELAEFYRLLLDLHYRPGDEPQSADDDASDWLVLTDEHGRRLIAFQRVSSLRRTTWPEPNVPMQMHLDFTVTDRTALERHHARALELGAVLLVDQSTDPDELLYVYADPAGHPFCIFVAH